MNLTKEDIDNFLEIQNKIFIKANEVLSIINDVEPIKGYCFIDPKSIIDGWVIFSGSSIKYGDHRDYEYRLDIRFIHDSDVLTNHLNSIKAKHEKERLNRVSKEQNEIFLKEQEELETYLKLKRKYE